MPRRERTLALLLAATCGLGGCAANPAPPGWLRRAQAATADIHGAWIVVPRQDGAPGLAGEFLGVGRDSIFVLGTDGAVRTMPLAGAGGATLAYYDAAAGTLGLETAVGALSTIANGFFLVFTAPAWLAVGGTAAARGSRAALRHVEPGASWDAVRPFARFPAGPPEGLPRVLPVKPVRRAGG